MVSLNMPAEAMMKTGDAALKADEQPVLGGCGVIVAGQHQARGWETDFGEVLGRGNFAGERAGIRRIHRRELGK